jgi:hypothetical protein
MRLRKEAQGAPPTVEREKLIRQATKGVKPPGSHHLRSNNMTPHIPEERSTVIDWHIFAIMTNTMPPRDPNDDYDEEDEEDEEENRTDEPPVVREPDED